MALKLKIYKDTRFVKFMLRRVNRRGVSPVIATVLLIAIALVLAIIVFLWAKSFIGEKTKKFGEPIEFSCEDISFIAEAFDSDEIDIENKGNVPIYGIEVRKKDTGTILDAGRFEKTIGVGETESVTGISLAEGDEILVVPIVLGETGEYKKAYTCPGDYGIETTVEI